MDNQWPPEGFVYGIDVSRFQDSNGDGTGDLAGLATRLDHVAALGASWVWLLPGLPGLHTGDGRDVHDHESVDPRLGTLDDLRAVIEGCHRRGLRVMTDLTAPDRGRDAGDAGDSGDESFDELARIASVWLERGIDGLRVDAAAPSASATAGSGDSVAVRERFYARLRARLSAARPDVVLVAGADAPLHELALLTSRDRVDAVVDFTLNTALANALESEDVAPLREALSELDRSVQASARLNIGHNAVDDARRFRMARSLLFALPGVPLLMSGDELGITDDPDSRGPVPRRPHMPWRAVHNQGADTSSHLVLTRRVARLRARARAASNPARLRTIPHSPGVLALSIDGCLTLHNLSAEPAEVFEAYGAEPLLYERWNGHRLGPYGFAWFRT